MCSGRIVSIKDMDLHGVQGLVRRPTPHELGIDPTKIGDVLYIVDFLYTFQIALNVSPFTINQLYSDLT
jgi:hypothetical protein